MRGVIDQGPINAAINEEMFGHGIFNVDGDEWKQQRRVAASEFASAKLRDFSTNVFKEYAVRLAFILEDFRRSQPPLSFDLQVLISLSS
jgi:cytochrome P450